MVLPSVSSAIVILPGPRPGVYFSQALSPADDPVHQGHIWDDFISGGTTNEIIGALGWTLWGVGAAVTRDGGDVNHPGYIALRCGAGNNTCVVLGYLINLTPVDVLTVGLQLTWIFRPSGAHDNVTRRVGMADDFTGLPSTGLYFEHLVGEANWYAVSRGGVFPGVETRADTGVPVASTDWRRGAIIGNAGTGLVDYYIDDILVASMAAIASVAEMQPGFEIIPNGAVQRSIQADLFDVRFSGLQR